MAVEREQCKRIQTVNIIQLQAVYIYKTYIAFTAAYFRRYKQTSEDEKKYYRFVTKIIGLGSLEIYDPHVQKEWIRPFTKTGVALLSWRKKSN
jgi:hypothetical protein